MFICSRSFQGFLKSRETPSGLGARQGAKMTNVSLHCWDLREERRPPWAGWDLSRSSRPCQALPSQLGEIQSDAVLRRACRTVLTNLQWFVSFRGYDFLDNMTLSPPIPDRELCAHFAMATPGRLLADTAHCTGLPDPAQTY